MIKVNGEYWRVRLVPPYHPLLIQGRSTPAIGCCDDISKTICVSNALTESEIKKVLCHEIVHAAMYSYDVELTYNEEELVADLIATFGDEIMKLTHIVYDNFNFI